MIEESRLTGEVLAAAVRDLICDRERLVKMGEAARSLAVPDAAGRLAGLLFEAETAVGGTA
jgi:UDP-N-acetylglucosamine:LPS N-acetylglucosamine transferase